MLLECGVSCDDENYDGVNCGGDDFDAALYLLIHKIISSAKDYLSAFLKA